MSHRASIRRAETLRRVAEIQQQLSRVQLAQCLAARETALERLRTADAFLQSQQQRHAATAGELVTRQAQVLAAAQTRSDMVKASAQAHVNLEDARRAVVGAAVQLRGRERLKDRRVRAWLDYVSTVDQKLLDDIGATREKGVS